MDTKFIVGIILMITGIIGLIFMILFGALNIYIRWVESGIIEYGYVVTIVLSLLLIIITSLNVISLLKRKKS